jgi:hypothetical protein
MRRYILAIIVISAIGLLAGCSNKKVIERQKDNKRGIDGMLKLAFIGTLITYGCFGILWLELPVSASLALIGMGIGLSIVLFSGITIINRESSPK